MGILYLVPTPVGNLEDMTCRALRVLKEADLILAEDTRTTGILLKHFEIKNAMLSYHKFNEHQTVSHIVSRLLAGETVAVVSDAGTPGISDPGFLVAREAVKAGVEVVCLPGPTAFVPALVASGIPCDRFCFEGFLPVKKGRATRLAALAAEERTLVFYESPHRVVKTLGDIAATGPARLVIGRELTKAHEEIIAGSVEDVLSDLSAADACPGRQRKPAAHHGSHRLKPGGIHDCGAVPGYGRPASNPH